MTRLQALRDIVIERLGCVRLRDDRLVRPLLVTAMAVVLAANGVSLEKEPSGRRRKKRKDAAKKRDDGWCDAGDCGDCCCGDGCCDCS